MNITKETMSALLGRSLTSYEDENFETYLKIANESLDNLLCMRLCSKEYSRVFDVREGYSTVFVDTFASIDEVKIDDEVVTNYQVRQWNRRSGSWYNSLVFDCRFREDTEVEISAKWGFKTMPSDLQSLLAGLFGQITKKNKQDPTVSSKQVEDFRISFNTDADLDTEFNQRYASVIDKYSLCYIGDVKHGGC